MDAKQRIRELMAERNWSEYRLAIASELSQSTVANIFNRNTTPSVSTLESICKGFGITLAQFFAEGNMVELTDEQQQMFQEWSSLTAPQKEVLRQLIAVTQTLERFRNYHMILTDRVPANVDIFAKEDAG